MHRSQDESEGVSLEVWGRAPFSGRHFEAWNLELVREPIRESAQLPDPWNAQAPEMAMLWMSLDGQESLLGVSALRHPVPMPDDVGAWHRYVIQVAPNGLTTLLVDGRVHVRWQMTQPIEAGDSVQIALFGASLDNEILHGPVTVYEGLRYVF